jgi:ABC-2 type transport system ATP-binding protein
MTPVNDEPAVVVKGLYKSFKLPHEQSGGIKQILVGAFRTKKRKGYEVQHVLDDISFEVMKGEFFGIVGRNGSGKSTLLKILAGVYAPDKGVVQVNGILTPFIELGVGFNHELTGKENIFLNGALLGMSRGEIEAIYDEIVSFAELGNFMDQKLKNYSSGMQVRLAFSIAIRAKSDVIIMDEVLAVGDAAFQKKCFDIFRELKNNGKTIILVTHDMGSIERFCDRVLIVDKGGTKAIATPQEAAAVYNRLNVENNADYEDEKKQGRAENRWGRGGIKVESISFKNKSKKTNIFEYGDDVEIEIKLKRSKGFEMTPFVCGLAIFNENNANIFGPNSQHEAIKEGTSVLNISIPNVRIAPGEYTLTTAIFDAGMTEPYDFLDKTEKFNVISDHVVHGMVFVDTKWKSE